MTKHVILKLISGETIMAELINSSSYAVTVRRPVQVRMIPSVKDGVISEEPLISIYCQFTYEDEFEFKDSIIVYCKPIIDRIAPFYEKTAKSLYEVEVTHVSIKEYDHGIDNLREDPGLNIDEFDKSKIVH